MAEENTTRAHILIFPYPAQGHMLPLLDFTSQLALHPNLTLTILITPKNLHLLTPLLSTHPHIQTLILPFPNHPSIPIGAENVKDLPANSFSAMICAMGGLYNPILHWFQSHPSPPTLILSDFFLGWTHHLAVHLSIPRVVFCTSGSITLSITTELWRDMPKKPDDPNEVSSFGNVPNCPNYPWWQLSNIYRAYKKGDPDSEFVKDCMLANLVSWGMVFNSFTELESVHIEHMKKVLGHERVWAVGPLIAHGFDKPIERGGSSSVSGVEILSWLDTCDDHSVVYICFGSQAVLSNDQMEELALGLEQSRVRFIWSVKTPPDGYVASEYGMIPDGFEERMAGRGIVIKGWAPQVLILKHRAVGAFLSHCGWNSVLESLVAGVPMLTWPFGADQFTNAKLLIEEMGVAIKVCEGQKTIPNRIELAQAVAKSVSEKGFLKERVRAIELSKAALCAVIEGGSSFKSMEGLVKEILRKLTVGSLNHEILNPC